MRAPSRATTRWVPLALLLIASCARPLEPLRPSVALDGDANEDPPLGDSGIDWGAKLFPPKPAADPAPAAADPASAAATPAPTPTPSPALDPPLPPPHFEPSDLPVSDSSTPIEARSLSEVCAAFMAVPPVASREGVPGKPRSCKPLTLSTPFTPTQQYLGVSALRLFDGTAAFSQLYVQTPSGLAALPVGWDVVDPDDPGCPSMVRLAGVEQLRVERGMLVVVALGEDSTWVDPINEQDGGRRTRLTPQVVLADLDGDVLHTRVFQPRMFGGADLGEKVQPAPTEVPWHRLDWSGRRGFSVSARGTLLGVLAP
ncbi:MAG: hypothetical protein IPM79_37715 [Polyangiaceae bacterium]|nr:hypothetical protein [Polyangiaceae bacterium]MBK8943186.1 hypothetical protein [Polyangiaceae bacterium]